MAATRPLPPRWAAPSRPLHSGPIRKKNAPQVRPITHYALAANGNSCTYDPPDRRLFARQHEDHVDLRDGLPVSRSRGLTQFTALDPSGARPRSCRACVLDWPVSLIMRYGQRAELRCLKYLRRLRASVVSLIMRQIDALSVLSHQVSGAGASSW